MAAFDCVWAESAAPGEALKKWPHILDTSLYWKQINLYRRTYSDNQILVLFFEDFLKQPQVIIDRCYDFLGVNKALAVADPAKPSHVTANMRLDGVINRLLRRVPGAHTVKKLAPRFVTKFMGKFRHRLPERPDWPRELRQEVIRHLRDDTSAFLRFYGKSSDFWQLS